MRAATLAALALVAAAPAAAQVKVGPISMPPGWDDRFFDKLEANKPLSLRVQVADVQNREELEFKTGLVLREIVEAALAASGRFELVTPRPTDAAAARPADSTAGAAPAAAGPATRADSASARPGPDATITATVAQATERINDKVSTPEGAYVVTRVEVAIDMRLVGNDDGTVLGTASQKVTREVRNTLDKKGKPVGGSADRTPLFIDATKEAAAKAAAQLGGRIALAGAVVKFAGTQVTVDVGEARGVKGGDRFVVFRKGNQLSNAAGEAAGFDKTVIGLVEVTSTERSLSTGRLVQRAQATLSPRAGDFVILAPAEAP